jgi:glutathione peroxidase-family protein
MDKPHSKYLHLYAIVRFDPYLSGANGATVVKVFPSKQLAEQEASRPREVNKGKQSTYAVQIARFVESL